MGLGPAQLALVQEELQESLKAGHSSNGNASTDLASLLWCALGQDAAFLDKFTLAKL